MTSAPRRFLPALLVAFTLAFSGLIVPSPANATISRLCYGYTQCADRGYGNFGYKSGMSTMWWRMYAGHNCTNYVAYRMVQSGMPNIRPWSGSGNATYWGVAMASITDQTPTVGSVAWWKANVPGAGSAGHVAYVEEVVSPTEIIVSQSSWGGDFSWARITKSGTGWPSGFIHFNDKSLTNATPPAVTGTAQVGNTLTATPGTWKPGEVETTYQWRMGGKRVAGATSPTLPLDARHLGRKLKVRVTATIDGYQSSSMMSTATRAVAPGLIDVTTPPAISGTPTVDQTLTASDGAMSPAPESVTRQWFADGQAIEGATASTLKLTPELVGSSISVRTIATRTAYDTVDLTTPATAAVAPGTLVTQSSVSMEGGSRPGDVRTVTVPKVKPAPASTDIAWLRNGVPIKGADEATYTLSAADLGSVVTAQVTYERPGYTTVAIRAESTRPVRSATSLDVSKLSHPRRFRVQVSAAELGPVDTDVLAKRGGQVIGRVALEGGSGVLRLPTLKPGKYAVRFVVKSRSSSERLVDVRTIRIG